MNLMSSVICEGKKLFVHYKPDAPLCRAGSTGICKQAKKRKVSIPPLDKFVVVEPVKVQLTER